MASLAVGRSLPLVLSQRVTFVTGNAKKLEEVVQILGNSIPFCSIKLDCALPIPAQLQGEPEEISKEKARLAAKEVNGPVLVEDTCLCFNALKRLPGPNIKWFMQKIGHEAVLRKRFPTDLCKIVTARGPTDFVLDSVFQPDGYVQTYAEMAKEEKNKICHRYRALAQVKSYFADAEYILQTEP